jgi:hypothetical protein
MSQKIAFLHNKVDLGEIGFKDVNQMEPVQQDGFTALEY